MIIFNLRQVDELNWSTAVAQLVERLTYNPNFKGSNHRDKTRLQMPAKMFPHLKLLCWLFMGATLCFDTKQRNSFLIKFGGVF
jgi:hypothetical protein